MSERWLLVGAVNGFLSVLLGAFAAHLLKAKLEPRLFDIFEVGNRYHMYHSLALLAVAWAAGRGPSSLVGLAGVCFTVGIVLFSGSLYVLALTGVNKLGIITPFGGLAFLSGWALLAVAAVKLK
jgi:uncharacterized membrane protein YgdD (TMEM256/DUF423 family)